MSKKRIHNYYDNVSERRVRVIPLGGLEQIGMNITVFEYGNSLIAVDCGLAFPDDDMPGVDLVVPDVTYLHENKDRFRAFFITHGHEDHIGALPYILKDLNVPVYGTRLTMAIISGKLEEHGMLESVTCRTVSFGDVVNEGDFSVEYIRVNHSIPDSAMLAIGSPAGQILMTGDFKVDYSPVLGEPIDLQRIGELGKKGVLAVLSDSTNATRPGSTPTERSLREILDSHFSIYKGRRILIATFASNVGRVQQIIDSAVRVGRKVIIEGRSMVTVTNLARELGYLDIPDSALLSVDEMGNYPEEDTVILMTGSQGEGMAALSRVASGRHSKIHITENDVVIFSSTPIPGNEKAVSKVINDITIMGATVINRATHVSGHACEEDLKLIYTLARPKYVIPVHGEFRQRHAAAEIARTLGYDEDRVFLMNSGDILSLSENDAYYDGAVQHGGIMVDGLGVGDVGNIVIRDRQTLSSEGILIVAMTIDRNSGEVLAGPDIVSRGFVYVREAEALIGEATEVVRGTVEEAIEAAGVDWTRIKSDVREALGAFLWKKIKRSPLILPIIMEVEI